MLNKDSSDGQYEQDLANRINILRAGVLGANDGIVSVAGLVIGVAGATTDNMTLLITGLAGLVAGALSMAGGEYVSVSTQRDTEESAIKKEAYELETNYQDEVEELTNIYQQKGLSKALASKVAVELMNKDALAAHAEAELNIEPGHYANPWNAALSSLFAFSIGALLPLLSITLLPEAIKILGTFFVVVLALALTGIISAWLGNSSIKQAVMRNILVGIITMVVTYSVGYVVKV